jgi:hypothetical protein
MEDAETVTAAINKEDSIIQIPVIPLPEQSSCSVQAPVKAGFGGRRNDCDHRTTAPKTADHNFPPAVASQDTHCSSDVPSLDTQDSCYTPPLHMRSFDDVDFHEKENSPREDILEKFLMNVQELLVEEVNEKLCSVDVDGPENMLLFEKECSAEDTDGVSRSMERALYSDAHPFAASLLESGAPTATQDSTCIQLEQNSLSCLNEQTTEKEVEVAEIVPADSIRESQYETTAKMTLDDLVQNSEGSMTCIHNEGHEKAMKEQEDIPIQSNLEGESSTSEELDVVEVGDIVLLTQGVPREFCNRAAIVTKASSSHCTVVVLDESRRYGMGECWPNYESVVLESTILRLGTRVVVGGLQNAKIKHLNGQVGVISTHPRQGHPVLIDKPACPSKPQLTVCVALSDQSVKERSVLLEPRFLTAWQEESMKVTKSLSETAALLLSGRSEGKHICQPSETPETLAVESRTRKNPEAFMHEHH